jgi:hypothetical protein
VNGRYRRPVSGGLLRRRSSIAGALADNARMMAIQAARKRDRENLDSWKFLVAE